LNTRNCRLAVHMSRITLINQLQINTVCTPSVRWTMRALDRGGGYINPGALRLQLTRLTSPPVECVTLLKPKTSRRSLPKNQSQSLGPFPKEHPGKDYARAVPYHVMSSHGMACHPMWLVSSYPGVQPSLCGWSFGPISGRICVCLWS